MRREHASNVKLETRTAASKRLAVWHGAWCSSRVLIAGRRLTDAGGGLR